MKQLKKRGKAEKNSFNMTDEFDDIFYTVEKLNRGETVNMTVTKKARELEPPLSHHIHHQALGDPLDMHNLE